MSTSERLNAAWNSQDPGQVAAVFAEGGVRHQFAHEEVRLEGRGAVLEMITAVMHAVPDCSLEIRNIMEAGNEEAFDWTFRGTVQNDFGPIPGKGQSIDLNGCSTITLAPDGAIQEERVYWDGLPFLIGAGLLD